MTKPFETYRDRDENLSIIGFSSYSDYLESSLWKVIRGKIFARDNWKCTIRNCKLGKRRLMLEAHHISYSLPVLLGIEPGSIVTLCSYCHRYLEFDGKRKLSLQDVQKKTIKNYKKRNGQLFKSVPDFIRYRHKTKQDHVARYILTTLFKREITWYDVILREILITKRIHKSYLNYLRIE